ncbi:hypothetical protein IAD21_00468 [Abditibacteriota bacterium]|nr:hypothetical protein IAD21_00468 [Abditibacteriota bacterium]
MPEVFSSRGNPQLTFQTGSWKIMRECVCLRAPNGLAFSLQKRRFGFFAGEAPDIRYTLGVGKNAVILFPTPSVPLTLPQKSPFGF